MTHPSDMAVLVERLRALLAKATPGPWAIEHMGGSSTVLCGTRPRHNDTSTPAFGYSDHRGHCIARAFTDDGGRLRRDFVCFSHDDARLIVEAINALPALLDALSTDQRTGQEVAGLVEQAAKAMHTHHHAQFGRTWESEREESRQDYRDLAKAALTKAAPPVEGDLREAVARLLCEQHGGDPDAVATEEHDCWDGQLWTVFLKDADAILTLQQPRSTPVAGDIRATYGDRVVDITEALADEEITASEATKRVLALLSLAASPLPVDACGSGERIDALAQAFCLLDTFAGEGLGHTYGNGQTIMADDVVTEIAEAFGFECEPGWWRELAAALHAAPAAGEKSHAD